ncbi:NAD(P)-dependent oxidoreductase [Acidipila sp. EB88]|uniref:NAD(P)-dependent oxidoreductase n=1 Tax=Acidipila sp. EB88 TaxID=2305226 RepID=UPI000F5E8547|nr:NAD(P)-dependent oxidoreductase [Acidipila sp. EB88]RRA48786.1 NAD(P)-dependent oxidoreductase [Acidipila sp. EB88]
MRIAFLGLGQMGSGIARLLVAKGYDTVVWNRTATAAAPLQQEAAQVAATAAEAVRDAKLIFTMLNDDAAVEGVLFEQGALAAIPKDATHVSLSTISVDLAQRLEREHAAHGQGYVGSPVFGRPNIAAEGKLWLAVAGPDTLLQEITPILECFSRGITVVGEKPSVAHALKLGGNFLITAMIASLSESFTFAEAHGIDPQVFLETVNSALFQSAFYANYGKVMLDPPEKPGATMKLGAKDMTLYREAAKETATRTPLGDIFQQNLNAAIRRGNGDKDWAAGYLDAVRAEAKGLQE